MTNSIWQATIQNEAGDIVPGAQIDVVLESTGLPAVIYSDRAGAALSNPFFATSEGFAQFYAGPGEYRITATNTGTAEAQTWRYERIGDGGSRDVQTGPADTTADRLMAVGAFGLGDDDQSAFAGDMDTLDFGYLVFVSSAATNTPEGGAVGTGVCLIIGGSSTSTSQDFIEIGTGLRWNRRKSGGVWQPWQPVYTGANLNTNVFGGDSVGDFIAIGVGVLSSAINLFLPISKNNPPSSITVSGDFSVYDIGGTLISSAATPVLIASSSNKLAFLQITGLSGVTANNTYSIRANSSSSSITVNP